MSLKLRSIKDFFQGMLLLMALVVVALVAAVTTMHFAIHGAEVRVPALKSMTVADARSQTSGLGLNLEVDNRYYSADVAAGHILSQSPLPGAVVRREWRVRVAESLGPQKVEVPSVLGNQERIAGLNLRRVGLEAGATAHLPWSSSETGVVLSQDPPPKAQGIERPSINLLVASADDTTVDGYVMPDLTGLPVVSAQSALSRVGIKSGEPRFVETKIAPVNGPGTSQIAAVGSAASSAQTHVPAAAKSSALPGTVLSQQPLPGYRVDVGSTVVLTVAR